MSLFVLTSHPSFLSGLLINCIITIINDGQRKELGINSKTQKLGPSKISEMSCKPRVSFKESMSGFHLLLFNHLQPWRCKSLEMENNMGQGVWIRIVRKCQRLEN